MSSLTLLAPAKINLYLEILGRRPDGFHEVAMVLQTIGLADRLHLTGRPDGQLTLTCAHPQVPTDSSNLAWRAAALMAEQFPDAHRRHGGVAIHLDKHIPVAAGLAGGSTDGAAVLVGLDQLWGLGLTQGELQDLAAQLGSDMPFCIGGGTALAAGRGELLSPLPDLEGWGVVVAKHRDLGVSTPWAYNTYAQQFAQRWRDGFQPSHAQGLLAAITQRDLGAVCQALHNDFEQVVLPAYPQVQALKATLAGAGVAGCLLSGSGPTVFALTEDRPAADQAAAVVRAQHPDVDVWATTLTAHGIQVQPQVV